MSLGSKIKGHKFFNNIKSFHFHKCDYMYAIPLPMLKEISAEAGRLINSDNRWLRKKCIWN